jgi:hypothetical protein
MNLGLDYLLNMREKPFVQSGLSDTIVPGRHCIVYPNGVAVDNGWAKARFVRTSEHL